MSASPRGKYSIKNMRSAARGLVPKLTAMKAFFIINDPPYGTERVTTRLWTRGFPSFRLAHSLAKQDAANQLTVFLMADAVLAAKARQKTPDGFYNIEHMLRRVLAGKGSVLLCGTCGLTSASSPEGAQRSTINELTAATATADKVLVFLIAHACAGP